MFHPINNGGKRFKSRLARVAEMHRHKHVGWVIHPSLEMVAEIFGDEFEISFLGQGYVTIK